MGPTVGNRSSRVFGSIIDPNIPVHPGLMGKSGTSAPTNMVHLFIDHECNSEYSQNVSQDRLQNLNNAILTHRAHHEAETSQRSEVMEMKMKTLDDKILRTAISEDERMQVWSRPSLKNSCVLLM